MSRHSRLRDICRHASPKLVVGWLLKLERTMPRAPDSAIGAPIPPSSNGVRLARRSCTGLLSMDECRGDEGNQYKEKSVQEVSSMQLGACRPGWNLASKNRCEMRGPINIHPTRETLFGRAAYAVERLNEFPPAHGIHAPGREPLVARLTQSWSESYPRLAAEASAVPFFRRCPDRRAAQVQI